MVVCATWNVKSWNSIHTMKPFLQFPWNSSNNASTLVIKFEFIILYSDSHMYTFCIVGSAFGKIIVFCLVTNTNSTPLDILMH
jgi:hypothetical protein